jgi:hypothetical protein
MKTIEQQQNLQVDYKSTTKAESTQRNRMMQYGILRRTIEHLQ